MAYNNIDQAVTIQPNQQLTHAAGILLQNTLRREDEERQHEQQEQARRNNLLGVLGKEFDQKNHATGTAYDPVINAKLAAGRERAAKALLSGTSEADVRSMIYNDVSDVTELSSKLKALNAGIEERKKVLSKFKGVDADAWANLAKNTAIYKVDPKTGQKSLKNPNEIDPSVDYFQKTAEEHPELIAMGEQGIRNFTQSFKPVDMSTLPTSYEKKGITITRETKAHVPAYQTLVKDKDGRDIGIKVRSKVIPELSPPEGAPFEVVDDEVYGSYVSDPGTALYLNKQLKEFNQASRTKIDPNSPEADIWKSHYLFNYLTKNGTGTFSAGYKETKNNLVDRQEMGLPNVKQSTGGESVAAEVKATAKLQNSKIGAILGAMGGNQSILEGGVPQKVNGKTYYDLTGETGALKLTKAADGKYLESKVMVDPVSNTLRIETPPAEDGADPTVQEYAGKDLRRFIKQNSEKFGTKSITDVDKILNMHMDGEGNYTAKKDPAVMQQASVQRAEERQAAAANKQRAANAIPAINDFQNSADGEPSLLQPMVGVKLNDGTTVKRIVKRSWYKPGPKYYIEFTTPEGKVKTVDFDQKYPLGDYLNKRIQ
jgi:hypothetical protein